MGVGGLQLRLDLVVGRLHLGFVRHVGPGDVLELALSDVAMFGQQCAFGSGRPPRLMRRSSLESRAAFTVCSRCAIVGVMPLRYSVLLASPGTAVW